MRLGFLLLVVCMELIVAGCGERKDPTLGLIREDIDRCEKMVLDGNVEASANVRYDLFKRTFDRIAAIPDAKDKILMAKELSSLVKEIDLNLQGSDFLEFADRVSRFKSLLDWSVWSLLDANAESEYTFQCLMNGMAKYRKACFSIPIAVRADNESVESYARKCEATMALVDEYEYAMIALDKAERGHLRSFPQELHDRYREWKKTLQMCPKSADVRSRLRKLRSMR